ncbi:MAG: CoA ester lyase [Candidatus Rokubacteria bacterium]|nr:CoA ester lyase [Candidatus Rokubacteria bacterium]
MSRLRRSLLFVTGADAGALERARDAGADTLILDLEDTVAPDRKAEARRVVTTFLAAPRTAETELAVRINAVGTIESSDDVRDAARAGADALVVPKTESVETLRDLDARLGSLERSAGRHVGEIRLLPLIETPGGVLNAAAIAKATPRVDALVFGHVDLSRTLGIREAGAGEGTILHARAHLVLAAKAAAVQVIDAVFMRAGDPDGFEREARQGLALGYTGKLLIDAEQVRLVHAVYAPTADEIAYAERLVAAFETARADGRGLFVFEGRVIDLPVVEAERAVLARARRRS